MIIDKIIKNPKFISYFIVLLSYFGVPNLSYAAQILDKVVATVNNDVITQLELDNYLKMFLSRINLKEVTLPPQAILQKQILNKLIIEKIQAQLAITANIEIEPQQIDDTIKDIAQDEGLTVADLQHKVETNGITFTHFRNSIKTELIASLLQQRELAQEITISHADVDNFLASPAGQDHSGTQYRLGHILLVTPETPTPEIVDKVQQQANNLINELKAGANFAQMAMAKSAGQTALKGGDLSWRKLSEVPTIFTKYVPTMQVNEIAGPIRSGNGFHIIKLIDKRVGNQEIHQETHVRQILIKPSVNTSDDEALHGLKELRKQIINGADFAKLAQKKSEELNTAAHGGDLGWVTEKAVLPEFSKQMAKLADNELSQPFKTDLGWHLIQVLGHRTQSTSTEAARNKALEILHERKYQELLETWLKRIRDSAEVEILLN